MIPPLYNFEYVFLQIKTMLFLPILQKKGVMKKQRKKEKGGGED